MNALGRHILAEIYGYLTCSTTQILSKNVWLKPLRAGAEVREVAFHKFSPQELVV